MEGTRYLGTPGADPEAIRFLKNKNLQSGADAWKGVYGNPCPSLPDNSESTVRARASAPPELVLRAHTAIPWRERGGRPASLRRSIPGAFSRCCGALAWLVPWVDPCPQYGSGAGPRSRPFSLACLGPILRWEGSWQGDWLVPAEWRSATGEGCGPASGTTPRAGNALFIALPRQVPKSSRSDCGPDTS